MPDDTPAAGSSAAARFEQLYRAYSPSVFRRARQLLGSDADAHEVVHDIFLSLYERPEQFAGRARMSTFLYSAVTHACLNRIRDSKNRGRLLALHAHALEPQLFADAPAEQMSVLRSVLARMPEQLAQLAVYHYTDGLTHEEIARMLGCSRRHVGHLLERMTAWVSSEVASCKP
jgi:RNA polymerase sigma-70 factor (ECF subfamily)